MGILILEKDIVLFFYIFFNNFERDFSFFWIWIFYFFYIYINCISYDVLNFEEEYYMCIKWLIIFVMLYWFVFNIKINLMLYWFVFIMKII